MHNVSNINCKQLTTAERECWIVKLDCNDNERKIQARPTISRRQTFVIFNLTQIIKKWATPLWFFFVTVLCVIFFIWSISFCEHNLTIFQSYCSRGPPGLTSLYDLTALCQSPACLWPIHDGMPSGLHFIYQWEPMSIQQALAKVCPNHVSVVHHDQAFVSVNKQCHIGMKESCNACLNVINWLTMWQCHCVAYFGSTFQ